MFIGHEEAEVLIEKLKHEGKQALVYAGFDPTGNSLHLGHLGVLSLMSKFEDAGHRVVAIVGTGTAFIGDPTGKNEMRKMLDSETIEANAIGIENDINRVIPDITFIRNEWLKHLNLQTFMREAGSRIPLNDILNLSIVKTRLESGTGITLMEAIYPVLQGWDMVVMARTAQSWGLDTVIQIGGQDQTGNIAMGIHLVNRLVEGVEGIGVVSPLIVTANGEKMGKSAGNALFLNPALTDDLLFFDSIVSTPDDLIPSMIDVLMPSLDKNADIIKIKKALAIGITGWVRGDEAVSNILKIKENGFDAGNLQTLEISLNEMQSGTISILHILCRCGFANSLSECRRLIKNKGVKVDGETIDEVVEWGVPAEFVLSKGKKNHIKIRIIE